MKRLLKRRQHRTWGPSKQKRSAHKEHLFRGVLIVLSSGVIDTAHDPCAAARPRPYPSPPRSVRAGERGGARVAPPELPLTVRTLVTLQVTDFAEEKETQVDERTLKEVSAEFPYATLCCASLQLPETDIVC